MVNSCAAFGCVVRKGDKVHVFQFPKLEDVARRKIWQHYCRREFEVKVHHSLCHKHFSDEQYTRNPKFMESIGYSFKVKPELKEDAVPDIPLQIGDSEPVKPKPRGAYEKRRRKEVS